MTESAALPAVALHRRRIGEDNRARVRRFFARHLCATNRECAAALGLSVEAVGRHAAAIRAEWLGEICEGCRNPVCRVDGCVGTKGEKA